MIIFDFWIIFVSFKFVSDYKKESIIRSNCSDQITWQMIYAKLNEINVMSFHQIPKKSSVEKY